MKIEELREIVESALRNNLNPKYAYTKAHEKVKSKLEKEIFEQVKKVDNYFITTEKFSTPIRAETKLKVYQIKDNQLYEIKQKSPDSTNINLLLKYKLTFEKLTDVLCLQLICDFNIKIEQEEIKQLPPPEPIATSLALQNLGHFRCSTLAGTQNSMLSDGKVGSITSKPSISISIS